MLRPESVDQLRDLIVHAVAREMPLALVGSGSKAGWGRPVQAAETVSLGGFSGITLYEPAELVMRAGAGTPLAEILAALEAENQMLAFEPPDVAPLWGGAAGAGTLGGAFSVNLGGPRRVKAGAARDHLLGFAGVSGRGEAFKAGGRVVKNVTGYDLAKLVCGAFGTLVALTELTFKVLPAPEKSRSVLVFGQAPQAAVEAMAAALGSPFEVSGAAYLPEAVAGRSRVDYVGNAGAAVTAIRVEGTHISVGARAEALKTLLKPFGAVETLHTMRSAALWREVRDAGGLLRGPVLWRLSLPPAAAAAVAGEIGGEVLADWGGGLLWIALPEAADGHAGRVRRALAATGGHATLLRAPDAVRAAVPVFQPEAPAVQALSARVRAAFDPKGILNPGRM